MSHETKNMIEELKEFGERPVGVFGARASGKTMFFTVLYGVSGFKDEDSKFSVVCKDEETRKYLSTTYGYVSNGELIPRTELTEINKIVMSYFYNDNPYLLKSFDFAGELLKENTFEEKELAEVFSKRQKALFQSFSNCSGILVFLEPNDNMKDAMQRKIEIDRLLGVLQDTRGKSCKDLPIAVVITKWDKVSTDIYSENITKDERRALMYVEEKKVNDYIEKHKVYKNIKVLIEGFTNYVKVFPVSAFGKAKDGDLPPDEMIKPFNIFNPLMWISEVRDTQWKDKVVNVLKEKINPVDAEEIMRGFKENVFNQEFVKEVDAAYKKFKSKNSTGKLIAVLIVILILAGGGGGGFFYYIKGAQSKAYEQAMTEKDDALKFDKIQKYIIKYGKEDERSKNLMQEKKKIMVALIETEKDSVRKFALINEFITENPDSEEVAKLEKIKVEIDKELKKQESQEKQKEKAEEAYKTLLTEVEKEKDNLTKYNLISIFMNSYPNFEKNSVVLKPDAQKYLKLADRDKYKEIDADFKKGVKDDSIYEKIEEYLAVKDFKENRNLVIELKDTLKEEDLYKTIKATIERYNTDMRRSTLKEVVIACSNYISNSTKGKYKAKVQSLQEQIKKIEKETELEIEFFILEKDMKLKNTYVEYKVLVGSEEYFLQKLISGNSAEYYVGSSMIKFGVDTQIAVTIYITDITGSKNQFGPEILKIENLNKPIKIGKVNVKLQGNTDKFRLID